MRSKETQFNLQTMIWSLWAFKPTLRFGQLIQFIAGDRDPFYIEDDEFLKLATDAFNKAFAERFGAQTKFDEAFPAKKRPNVE